MKPSEIEVGRCYANKSGTKIRKVIGVILLEHEDDIIEFKDLSISINHWFAIYRKSFARWADHKVKEPEGK